MLKASPLGYLIGLFCVHATFCLDHLISLYFYLFLQELSNSIPICQRNILTGFVMKDLKQNLLHVCLENDLLHWADSRRQPTQSEEMPLQREWQQEHRTTDASTKIELLHHFCISHRYSSRLPESTFWFLRLQQTIKPIYCHNEVVMTEVHNQCKCTDTTTWR